MSPKYGNNHCDSLSQTHKKNYTDPIVFVRHLKE